MDIFPSKKFWDNVIILRTQGFNDSKKGKILEGIKKDSKLMDCMKKNNIKEPANIKEFYIDLKSNDERKKNLLTQILNIIKGMDPIYKDIKIDEKYNFIEANQLLTVEYIKTTKYIDFNDKSEIYKDKKTIGVFNMSEERPILITVKREIGPWCKQYLIKYVYYKTYNFKGVKKTYNFVKDEAWEDENNDVNGEKYRQKLEEEENKYNTCVYKN